jgi:hypothetical protein
VTLTFFHALSYQEPDTEIGSFLSDPAAIAGIE